jgi:hypothetical protein
MASNLGFKGIGVRQTGSEIVIWANLPASGGGFVNSGTTDLLLFELQSDGTFKVFDFSTNLFTTGVPTTSQEAMTYRRAGGNTIDTGLWTYAQSTLTGFTVGAMYFAQVYNASAIQQYQLIAFQYGSAEGDLVVAPISTGVGYLDVLAQSGITISTPPYTATSGSPIYAPINYTLQQPFSQTGFADASWTQILFTVQTPQGKNLLQVQVTNGGQADDGLTIGPAGTSKTDGSITGVVTSPFGFTVNIDPAGMNIPQGQYNWEATLFDSTPSKQRLGFGSFLAMSSLWAAAAKNS